MISKYSEVLKKVQQLAVIRHDEAIKSSDGKSFRKLSEIEEHDDTSGLLEFLSLQDMETIKVIQGVMYIGRDYVPETEDEYLKRMDENYYNPENLIPEPSLKSNDPKRLLQEQISILSWGSKEVEVGQIYEKLPLDEYLERAFVILGIE